MHVQDFFDSNKTLFVDSLLLPRTWNGEGGQREGHSCPLRGSSANTRYFQISQICAVMQIEGCGKVELGATWFHGIVGNPLYEHAIQLGLMPRHEAEDSSKPTDYEPHVSLSLREHAFMAVVQMQSGECLQCQQQNSPEHAHYQSQKRILRRRHCIA